MAEEFEPYHVPQQNRRDKLRIIGTTQNHIEQSLQNCSSFGGASFYDQSTLISSYLQNCMSHEQKPTNHFGGKAHLARNSSPGIITKEDGVSFITGYALGESSSRILMSSFSSSNNTSVVDLQPSSNTQLNPNVQIQDFYKNINTPHLDQSFHGGGGKGLSLSLSSSQNYNPRSGGDGGGVGGGGGGGFSWNNNNEVGPGSLGYLMGYAYFLRGSSFLKPAQQLLDELCYVGKEIIYGERIIEGDDSSLTNGLSENAIIDDLQSCRDGSDNTSRRRSRLISLLHEVCRRYKQYYQQLQEVVASFESVTGLSNAAPFTNLALNSLVKHFRILKTAITHQLQSATKSQNKGEIPCFGNSNRPSQVIHRSVWRPQRGLPDQAVRVLKAWLYEHFLHPYPSDGDKVMLAKQTRLSRNQVSNWFINARVRLWKPMVEEIHTLETQQKQETSRRKEGSANDSNCSAEFLDFQSKSSQSNRDEQQVHPCQMHISSITAGGSNSVSLTLGLHQNNSVGVSQQFPGNAARRFGLDEDSQDYLDIQFGRNILGGQPVHDFVG